MDECRLCHTGVTQESRRAVLAAMGTCRAPEKYGAWGSSRPLESRKFDGIWMIIWKSGAAAPLFVQFS